MKIRQFTLIMSCFVGDYSISNCLCCCKHERGVDATSSRSRGQNAATSSFPFSPPASPTHIAVGSTKCCSCFPQMAFPSGGEEGREAPATLN